MLFFQFRLYGCELYDGRLKSHIEASVVVRIRILKFCGSYHYVDLMVLLLESDTRTKNRVEPPTPEESQHLPVTQPKIIFVPIKRIYDG